jgi:osmotically-inducible protein OsmY
MRKFFNGLVLGIILSAAAFGFVELKYLQPAAQSHLEAVKAQAAAAAAATTTPDAREVKLDMLELRDDQIRAELKKTNEIIRRKPRDIGETTTGPDSDNQSVGEIKAKYQADARLSPWGISVNCAHGHVTLIGTVGSVGDIGDAILVALSSGGVRDVTSTLQVKTNTGEPQSTNH